MNNRRAIQVGDVFAVRRPGVVAGAGESEMLGRVVSTEAIVGARHGCNLVYVYRPGAHPSLDGLLLPPLFTTHAPWSRGYFEHLRSEPLLLGDRLPCHSFRDDKGHIYDEESRPLQAPCEPVGDWRLYDRVDLLEEAIARALAAGAS
ncbi:MAG TPA: hypothetical protein VGM06_25665 [Polyangiaceae bacterium]